MTGKYRVVLLVLLLFVVPALVVLTLLKSSSNLDHADGAQPGGLVTGRVTRASGSPAADVDVVASRVAGNTIFDELARARTDSEGGFSLQLPATEGRYVLRFTGSLLLEQWVEFGWLTSDGGKVDPAPLAVEMQPGCKLEVEIVGADKRPAGRGEYELSGATTGGLFGGFSRGVLTRSGTFEQGRFEVDGLPPLSARMQIRLASGERVDSVLDLAEGPNRHKVEL